MINDVSDILKTKRYLDFKLEDKHIEELEEKGFCLIPPKKKRWDWIGGDPSEIRKIVDSLLIKEGIASGSEGKEEFTIDKKKKIEEKATRLGNLLNKNKIFKKISTLPEILWGSFSIINNDLKLSSVLFRQPDHNSNEQEIHIDWTPRRNIKEKYQAAVSFLYLEDSHKKNGATIVIPKSHKNLGYPCEKINPFEKQPDEITIDAPRGSILIMNALTWHKGGNNISGEKRGIIVVEYRNRKLKQLLNLKKYIDEETKKTFSEEENYLFGVREQDFSQTEKSYGPGEEYRKWLKANPQYDFKMV